MNKATISADIISSTSLNVEQRLVLEEELVRLLDILKNTFGSKFFFGRLIKGDYIECVFERPKHALKAALLIKSYIKSLDIQPEKKDKETEDFRKHAIRIAIGVGKLSIWEKEKGIVDGEAIHFSGRAVNEMSTSNKKTKRTLVFRSGNEKWNKAMTPIFELLDVLFAGYKTAQSEVVFHKLLGKSEKEISELLKKSRSTINQHSTATGWSAVESAVRYFENIIK